MPLSRHYIVFAYMDYGIVKILDSAEGWQTQRRALRETLFLGRLSLVSYTRLGELWPGPPKATAKADTH